MSTPEIEEGVDLPQAEQATIDRSPRSGDIREQFERPHSWAQSSVLPDPQPEEGYVFRWVRVSMMGEDDPRNVSQKMREGWEPVRASEYPELHVMSDRDTSYTDCIVIGGLMLCKNTTELVNQRRAHYAQMNKTQLESVDNNWMRENDPRMPLLKPERSTRVTYGDGSIKG